MLCVFGMDAVDAYVEDGIGVVFRAYVPRFCFCYLSVADYANAYFTYGGMLAGGCFEVYGYEVWTHIYIVRR